MDPPVLQAVNRLETLAQTIRQDEFDTFGVHVASQLRTDSARVECSRGLRGSSPSTRNGEKCFRHVC